MQAKLFSILSIASAAFAAAISSPPTGYPANVTVAEYPNGLPENLIPKAGVHTGLKKRDGQPGVYFCRDWHWSGYCVDIRAPAYECINLSEDLYKQVSSVGPDYPAHCFFYSNFNCDASAGSFDAYSPGYDNMNNINGQGWNDRVASYKCYPN